MLVNARMPFILRDVLHTPLPNETVVLNVSVDSVVLLLATADRHRLQLLIQYVTGICGNQAFLEMPDFSAIA